MCIICKLQTNIYKLCKNNNYIILINFQFSQFLPHFSSCASDYRDDSNSKERNSEARLTARLLQRFIILSLYNYVKIWWT